MPLTSLALNTAASFSGMEEPEVVLPQMNFRSSLNFKLYGKAVASHPGGLRRKGIIQMTENICSVAMQSVWIVLFLSCILFFETVPLQAAGLPSHPVLVLHSYHAGLKWTDDIMKGIREEFSDSGETIDLHVDYLDTMRNSSPEYLNRDVPAFFSAKFRDRSFELVMVSDNDAFDFVLKHRDRLFPNLPVIFCGVNHFQSTMTAGHPDVTGVNEIPAFRETIDLALRLHPQARQIAVLLRSGTSTGARNQKLLQEVTESFRGRTEFHIWDEMPLNNLKERVAELPDTALVLLAGAALGPRGRALSFEETAEQLAEISRVPLYSCWDFFLGHGIVGGKLISGTEQGRQAAKQALRVLRGEDPSAFPIVQSQANRYMFDYSELKKFGIDQEALPEQSLLTGAPPPFYTIDKGQAWSIGGAMIGMLVAIGVFFWVIRVKEHTDQTIRQSEDKLKTLLETANDAILMIDAEGKVVLWNPAAQRIFGYSAEEALGKNLHRMLSPSEFHASFEEGFESFRQSGDGEVIGKTLELKALRKNGEEFPIELSISRLLVRNTWHACGILRDITERKKNTEELHRSKNAAEAGNRAKNEFLRNISHELRTPMNGILGMLELLRDTELTKEQAEYLVIARQSANSLLELFNNLLDFSQIGSDSLHLRSVNFGLEETINATLNPLRAKAAEKGIQMRCRLAPGSPSTLNGDPDRLSQILFNIVSNAVKFTERGSINVHVYTETVHENAGLTFRLHVSVSDTGIGIPQEKLHLIFDNFTQIDGSLTRKYDGAGLGLSLSRHLAELMGGRIWVESTLNRGSTFHFSAVFTVAIQGTGNKLNLPPSKTACSVASDFTLTLN